MPQRVLAFGDSLTAGYYQMGNKFAPWSPLVGKLLEIATVDHIGFSGFTTGQMVDCLDSAGTDDVVPRRWPGLRHKLKSGLRYDTVMILAGTNDLADKVPTSQIVHNIAALHAVAHAAGARTVAMTMPESLGALRVEWLGRARDDANAALRAWATAQPPEQVFFVDAATIVPFRQGEFPRMWEPDGLHMSAKGYEAFGRGLASLVAKFLTGVPLKEDAPALGPRWPAGTRVRLTGLKGQASLNGQEGQLNGQAGREGRMGVMLDEGGKILSVRRENVEILAASAPAEPPELL